MTTFNGDNNTIILQTAQRLAIKAQAGQHYKVRKAGSAQEPAELQTPDQLIATRRGDSLHLRYADGSVVDLEGFYTECKSSSVCSVNVAGDTEAGTTLAADNAGQGAALGGEEMLVYAHGSHAVLMDMGAGPKRPARCLWRLARGAPADL